jgi:hypothetical protein
VQTGRQYFLLPQQVSFTQTWPEEQSELLSQPEGSSQLKLHVQAPVFSVLLKQKQLPFELQPVVKLPQVPGLHTQEPDWQVSVAAHELPHEPQWSSSVCRLTHVPLQSVSPLPQTH